MALHILSKSSRKFANCIIWVGAGAEQRLSTDPYAFVQEVTVDSYRDEASIATLKLIQWHGSMGRVEEMQEIPLFRPGEPIRIEAEFSDHSQEVMCGFVRDIKFDCHPDPKRPRNITVVCQDQSFMLDRKVVHRVWGGDQPVSDRFIVGSVLQQYGFNLVPESAAGNSELTLKQEDTDFRFLQSRARANGYELLFKGKSVYFGPMRLAAAPQPDIIVQGGATAHCRYFSFRNTKYLEQSAFHRACGELNGLNYGSVLAVGEPVGLYGVGEHYSGIYYVDNVFHHFNRGDYHQRFTLLRGVEGSALSSVTVGPFPSSLSLLYDVL